jgi:ABC-2 type transport system ATP-binding protein
VAYSPELPNLQTFLTPKELLNLVFHELSLPLPSAKREEEIQRVLELVGIKSYTDTKIGKLSKGMVQRLSVAQALIGSPDLLILDEPMIGLDPAGAAHFREIFREFAREGKGTVFMSSHIMSEVESLCTSVAIIHSGKLMLRGSVDDIIRRALNYDIIVLEAEGLTQSLINKIKQLDGVVDVVEKSTSVEVTVAAKDPENDIRPALSELVISSGAKLYTIRRADNMLERAYIETLRHEGGASD